MALNDNLLIAWNFDTITGSNSAGTFLVKDISNNYDGGASGFSANVSSMILKEDIKTGKKQKYDTLDGFDTIQIVDGDDERESGLEKPSSVKLMIENSMHQIVSDEMLNLFSNINAYALNFTLPNLKYENEYTEINSLRRGFFENILEKPNLEKYIEFYKWIDSSLGSLLDNLKPENSSDFSGLKIGVESHILERNKYQHPLPVTIKRSNIYKNADHSITILKNVSGSAVIDGHSNAAHKQTFLKADISASIASATNVPNKNYDLNKIMNFFILLVKALIIEVQKQIKLFFRHDLALAMGYPKSIETPAGNFLFIIAY